MPTETISTETWRITLPADWREAETGRRGGFHAESPDGAKGIYVTTWNVSKSHGSLSDKVRSFLSTDLRGLYAMEGRTWNIQKEWFSEQNGRVIAGFDAYDSDSSYRIISKIIGHEEWIVRSSFHDYHCLDCASSGGLLYPIADSLEIHG